MGNFSRFFLALLLALFFAEGISEVRTRFSSVTFRRLPKPFNILIPKRPNTLASPILFSYEKYNEGSSSEVLSDNLYIGIMVTSIILFSIMCCCCCCNKNISDSRQGDTPGTLVMSSSQSQPATSQQSILQPVAMHPQFPPIPQKQHILQSPKFELQPTSRPASFYY